MTTLRSRFSTLSLSAILSAAAAAAAPASTDLARCLDAAALPRVVRVVPGVEVDGLVGAAPVYARVVQHADGVPTAVSPIGPAELPLDDVLTLASSAPASKAPVWAIEDASTQVCSPVPLSQREIDGETRVVVAAGLNYAAHAEEAGGGDVFLFPKPVEPGAPYAAVLRPEGVSLLDYEVELAFVLLEDVDLASLPSRKALLARSAFFVSNDLTDREPIIVRNAFFGPGTGFVEAKGQSGFLPAGPWMVRGTELFAALERCGGDGLGLRLEVDEGRGFEVRQDASTAAMILDPHALLVRLADEVATSGARTAMSVEREGELRHYPLAIAGRDGSLRLPAGSIVVTGTPGGIALRAPSPLGVIGRGLVNLHGPFEQFRQEQLERAAAREPGGYLEPGDRVRAQIDGLGTQIFRIEETAVPGSLDPCSANQEAPHDS